MGVIASDSTLPTPRALKDLCGLVSVKNTGCAGRDRLSSVW
jgi:hypothetical protein